MDGKTGITIGLLCRNLSFFLFLFVFFVCFSFLFFCLFLGGGSVNSKLNVTYVIRISLKGEHHSKFKNQCITLC